MEEIVRQRLPMPGAWGYIRRGDLLVFVFDECFTKDEIATRVELVKFTLSADDDGTRPSR